jgi:hypothetical protein
MNFGSNGLVDTAVILSRYRSAKTAAAATEDTTEDSP